MVYDDRKRIKKLAIAMAEEDGLINLSLFQLCLRANIVQEKFPAIMGCGFKEFLQELRGEGVGVGGEFKAAKQRVCHEIRRDNIVEHAAQLAREFGYSKLTRNVIAEYVGVSGSLISKRFDGHLAYGHAMHTLRQEIIKYAIERQIPEIIAEALVNKEPLVNDISESLRRKALKYIRKL